MGHIDFVIAFILMISIIFFVVLFISNSFSTELSAFTINELKESSYYFEKQLFEILDNKSLISDAGEIQIVFEEIGGYGHTEEIIISIEPLVSKLHVYDTSMNEIPSTSTPSGDSITLSFWLTFSSNEKKRVNIFYFGDSIKNIDYTSVANNITARMISDKRVNVVSQEKCSQLNNIPYEQTKENFGFEHQFQINLTDCNYGQGTSGRGNIIISSVPVLLEKSDGLISAETAKLMVYE